MHETPQPTRIEVIARGVMFHEEHVLLCQNCKHGYYYLPGGHVEPGEAAAAKHIC
jgi:ADP-ribose pyrophosphatase YjhB (NUDIX family)